MIVEGHAGRDHVDEGKALVHQPGLDQGDQLGLVAGKGTRDKACAQSESLHTRVDRRLLVGESFLGFRPDIRGRRKLSLGQPVHTVVLDDVEHVEIAPDGMGKLAESDGEGIAVTGYADIVQLAVHGIGASGHRRHASVHAIDAVRLAHEIGRRLGRTADTGHFRRTFGCQVQLPEGLHQRGRHRVMTAAGAQCRHHTFIVPDRQAQLVFGQVFVDEGFRHGGHAASPCAARCAAMPSTMNCGLAAIPA